MVSVDTIKLKSLKEATEESDGLRILIARYRPRYLRKEDENWHVWWKELAPSKSLWKEYLKDKKIDWDEYSRRYILEILNNPLALKALDNLASLDRTNNSDSNHEEQQQQQQQPQSQRSDILSKYDTVTLLCHCKDENHCHRFLVKRMVKGSEGDGRPLSNQTPSIKNTTTQD
jgi:uncharacterized protein YeaO (DUF488 family)